MGENDDLRQLRQENAAIKETLVELTQLVLATLLIHPVLSVDFKRFAPKMQSDHTFDHNQENQKYQVLHVKTG